MDEIILERRHETERILEFAGSDLVKVLTGMRRTGKSTILQLLQNELVSQGTSREAIISVNFEDYANRHLATPEALHHYLVERIDAIPAGHQARIFLDEIQEVPGFESVVNSLRTVQKADLYITGSNSRLLAGELATRLAGRYVAFTVFPFSYREFREARLAFGADASFEAFLAAGAMPYPATHPMSPQALATYLSDVYNSVVLKDLVARHSLRNTGLLSAILAFTLEQTGNIVSANSIAKYLRSTGVKASTQTVLDYLDYAAQAHLIYPARRSDWQGKRILEGRSKFYCADHGLRSAIVGDGLAQIQGILENIVHLEFLRRSYEVTVGAMANGTEIDFVAARGDERRYVQVSYLLAGEETEAREFAPLLAVNDNHPKTVLSLDPILRPRAGIEHRRIDEFLLDESW